MTLEASRLPADQDSKVFAHAQRLAHRATIFSDRVIPVDASAADLDASAVRILEAALMIAKGLEPDQPAPKKASPGAPPTDWKLLTGKSLDQLIYEVRLHAVTAKYVSASERTGISIPWKQACEIVLKPMEAVHGTDTYRASVARLAEQMRPSRLTARYANVDGWKTWGADNVPAQNEAFLAE